MFATVFYRKGTEDEAISEAIAEFSEGAVLARKIEIPESTEAKLVYGGTEYELDAGLTRFVLKRNDSTSYNE